MSNFSRQRYAEVAQRYAERGRSKYILISKAFIREQGNGRLGYEEQIVTEELRERGIEINCLHGFYFGSIAGVFIEL